MKFTTTKYIIITLILIFVLSIFLYIKYYSTAHISSPIKTLPNTDNTAKDQNIAITIHYHEKPPYYITGDLDVYGLCADPVKEIFKQAGIKFRWEKTPAKRQLEIIKENHARDCGLGWYKTSERETFAKYSLPIYQDRGVIAVKKRDNPKKIMSNRPIEEILSNRELTLLLKSGYSDGQFIDDQIAKLNPKRIVTTIEPIGMLKMISLGRADYFFIAEEEAEALTATSGLPKDEFEFIRFSDMPEGNKRYLIFSKMVEDELIEKINKAIQSYKKSN
ncbi:MAG: transporter substrate-binding domain-containing protein [Desulfamplus sp.]|nr:transporter substrate-binding domain-containing protein [Desulfamplus sp.]